MGVRITTLTENTAGKTNVLAEHGLSLLVEVDGLRILVDTGQTSTAVHNARVLGVDLRRLDAIVLSHGHGDHGGGLKEVLREADPPEGGIPVIGHPDIWSARYSCRKGEKPRFAGLPHRREELEALGARFHLERGPAKIGPGIMTTGEVPRVTLFERLDPVLKVKEGEAFLQDLLLDDQSLVLKRPAGLVIVLGCAHSGMVNTLLHARRITGENRIDTVVGGTHLGFGSKEQLEATTAALRGFDIQRLGVSHCTGMAAAAHLAKEFGERFFFNTAGTVTDLA
jgi:7,8-dihydropterin-6-yl-methyl-4-(beta-D-ribofuranosyl)aminobenzene 5'-phosphate synthase